MARPSTFQLPCSEPVDTVLVVSVVVPSVMATVAEPTGPVGEVTVPDMLPCPGTRVTFIGSAEPSSAESTTNRWVWNPARATVSR